MKNPFTVGQSVPPEFDEMYQSYEDWGSCPPYLDNQDFLYYGLRGHIIETQQEADRLFEQYLEFLKTE